MRKILLVLLAWMCTLSCTRTPVTQENTTFDINPTLNSTYIGPLMYVPAGTFQYDGNGGDTNTITEAFHMSAYDITGDEFTAVTGFADPSKFSEMTHPVECVNWYMAVYFCNALSILEGLTPVYSMTNTNNVPSTDPSTWGLIPTSGNDPAWDALIMDVKAGGYRLPTEMEWMWAAMGAVSDRKSGDIGWGINTNGYNKAFSGSTGVNNVDKYAWYTGNAGNTTHPAGTKLPNELGLNDMSGNVWQWCWDCWDGSAPYPGGTQTDYRGQVSSPAHIIRGGCWCYDLTNTTLDTRNYTAAYDQTPGIGFRVVRSAIPQ